jgi:hypothetical protein
MARYSFTVQVSGISPEGDRYEDALVEAGCDDALVAVIEGTMFLDFDRTASSFPEAVASARRNIERAGGSVAKVASIEK